MAEKQEKVFPWQPDIPEGYVRLYTDHTYRFYEDITEEEEKQRILDFENDPLCKIFREEIQKEIHKEILKDIIK